MFFFWNEQHYRGLLSFNSLVLEPLRYDLVTSNEISSLQSVPRKRVAHNERVCRAKIAQDLLATGSRQIETYDVTQVKYDLGLLRHDKLTQSSAVQAVHGNDFDAMTVAGVYIVERKGELLP
ncbi:hypothetical protein B5V46_04085 [Rhodovulum sp. MB263]|nr:hypothetical protein B5V46_04085 [Rhodovulum sp. MB263]